MKSVVLLCLGALAILPNQSHAQINEERYRAEVVGFLESAGLTTNHQEMLLRDLPYPLGKFECGNEFYCDTLFSNTDILQIHSEIRLYKLLWTTELFPTATIISHDTISSIFASGRSKGWERFRKNYGNKGLLTCSLPIFAKDYTYCLFYLQCTSGGLSGFGKFSLYQKKGELWILIKDYCSWIS
jgi:hypothetical protein